MSILFLQEFLRDPRATASVLPSSQALIDKMLEPIRWDTDRFIVELGPGEGCVTREILRRLRSDGMLWVFETNERFVDHLLDTVQDPRLVVVYDSAEHLCQYLDRYGFNGCDAIVSCLPLRTVPTETRDAILNGASAALYNHDGVFTQYRYTLSDFFNAGVEQDIGKRFPLTQRETVMWNLPPAHVFRAEGLNPLDRLLRGG